LAGEDIARQQNPRLATAPDQDLRDEPREAHGGE
jgi:hypothetical protein